MIRNLHRRFGRTLLTAVLSAVVGAAGGGLAVSYLMPPTRDSDPSRPGAKSSSSEGRQIPALGRIEPADGVISVYGPPGDRIDYFARNPATGRPYEVGAVVKRGTQLTIMASDPLREKEVELADLQYKDAVRQKVLVETSATAKREEAKREMENYGRTRSAELTAQNAKFEVAELQLQQAESQLNRVRSLTGGTIPRSEIAQQEFSVTRGQKELGAAKEALEAARKALADGKELAVIKERAADAEMKRAIESIPVDTLKLARDTAIAKREAMRVIAPVDGKIARIQSVPGETVTQVKPILLLASSGKLIVRAEVPDGEIDRVREVLRKGGEIPVTIKSRTLKDLALAGILRGEENLASTISRNAVIGLAPDAGGSDRRVVEAIVTNLQPDGNPQALEMAEGVLGLQVDVTLHLPGKK